MPQLYRAIRPMFKHNQWRIYPDDVVQVITGPEKGITGKVLAVIKDKKQPEVIVEGINMRKKKIYSGLKEDDFFVISMEAPVHYSNVMLVDPVSKKPVRTIFRYLPDGTKVRLSLGKDAAGHIIPIPQQKDELEGKYGLCGTKDTPQDEARRATFDATAAFPFAPSSRPSGLPMPPEPEASPAAPVDKGSWAAPAWLGAPRTALAGSTQQATTSGSGSVLGSGPGSTLGQAISSGAGASARPYCTSSQGALRCLEQLGALLQPSMYEWVVQRQRQSSGVQQV